ncbi:MAG: hypothetical protein Kow00124_31780 [Anaerolineae bacterium]
MNESLLDPRVVRMPDFAPGTWLNTPQPLTRESLRGRVVLVDFWDYTCVNCIRTLPYVTTWHERYAEAGLAVIGVHTPEFKFAQLQGEVEAALEAFNIRYPVLLDNAYQNWDRFAVRAWPTHFLIDIAGYVRFVRRGEGYYAETERAVQALLRESNPDLSLPDVMPPLRPEDAPGAVCWRTTPELYAGYERGALGNPEGYAANVPLAYRMPIEPLRTEGAFYVSGLWQATPDSLAFAGQEGGMLVLPYSAAGVNAVLSPSASPVEVALRLRRTPAEPIVEVRLDGAYLTPENAGADIEYDDGGVSYVLVESPRMYELVRSPEFGSHELELVFRANGLAIYTFTFNRCVAPGRSPRDPRVFQVR